MYLLSLFICLLIVNAEYLDAPPKLRSVGSTRFTTKMPANLIKKNNQKAKNIPSVKKPKRKAGKKGRKSAQDNNENEAANESNSKGIESNTSNSSPHSNSAKNIQNSKNKRRSQRNNNNGNNNAAVNSGLNCMCQGTIGMLSIVHGHNQGNTSDNNNNDTSRSRKSRNGRKSRKGRKGSKGNTTKAGENTENTEGNKEATEKASNLPGEKSEAPANSGILGSIQQVWGNYKNEPMMKKMIIGFIAKQIEKLFGKNPDYKKVKELLSCIYKQVKEKFNKAYLDGIFNQLKGMGKDITGSVNKAFITFRKNVKNFRKMIKNPIGIRKFLTTTFSSVKTFIVALKAMVRKLSDLINTNFKPMIECFKKGVALAKEIKGRRGAKGGAKGKKGGKKLFSKVGSRLKKASGKLNKLKSVAGKLAKASPMLWVVKLLKNRQVVRTAIFMFKEITIKGFKKKQWKSINWVNVGSGLNEISNFILG